MKVFLNENFLDYENLSCLSLLDDFIYELKNKGIENIYWSEDLYNFIILFSEEKDPNISQMFLSISDKIEKSMTIYTYQNLYKNYFLPIITPENPQLLHIKSNSSIAEAVEEQIKYPQENILLLNINDKKEGVLDNCLYILRKEPISEKIDFIKINCLDDLKQINFIFAINEIKKRYSKRQFEELENNPEFQKIKKNALSFNFLDWKPTKEKLLPLVELSNFLLSNKDITNEDTKALNLEFGELVAMINGYLYEKKISHYNETSNSKRKVYSAGKGRDKIYLSIEFEKKLVFEAFEFQGKHLGELNFYGKLNPQSKHTLKLTN